jgi:hypothetical protein
MNMSIAQAHLDIARERFLELMAENPAADPQTVAIVATSQADKFAEVYAQYGYKLVEPAPRSTKTKGCKACFGSGGKVGSPCSVCSGTGKVAA